MKRALVTGGSGSIGTAISRELSDNGFHVIVHAHRRLAEAESLAAAIRDGGGSAEAVAFDVCDYAATLAALGAILEAGPVQVLVNNAGIHDDVLMPAMDESRWRRVIDVSLNGFYNVTQPLLLPMLRTRWGRIINCSSVSALIGNRGQVNYAAAKGALNSATKALALEVASRGVTVNAIAPGIIDTAMSETAFDKSRIEQLVPMKRAGTPQEVANLVNFLASTESDYITGQIIAISGGIA